jgi:hypothetical protein
VPLKAPVAIVHKTKKPVSKEIATLTNYALESRPPVNRALTGPWILFYPKRRWIAPPFG